jgi:3-oxoacyl-[acyl-carrier-protein] synthase II
MRRVVVTGLGVASPLGCDSEALWARSIQGVVGVGAPRRYGAAHPPTSALAEVTEDEMSRIREEHPDAAATGDVRTLFAISAGAQAVEDGGLDPGPHPRAAVVLGAGPGVHRPEDVDRWLRPDGTFDETRFLREAEEVHAESTMRAPSDLPAVRLARRFGVGGPVHTITTACSASNQALGLAYRMIRRGEVDWALAGGVDSQDNPLGLVFFVLLGASAQAGEDPRRACRPFDRKRSGLVMGEGAGIVVLEALEHARARGARIYAEVAGYGSSLDAYRTTAPCPDGRGAAEAMQRALEDGGVEPGSVDFISAHGTATKRNDPAEVKAIRAVFGDHADDLAVSSSKGALGHLLAGAAGVAFVLSTLAVHLDMVPPTSNYENPDPQCDLDFVPKVGRDQLVRAALTNSFAFGGQNACMVLRKYEEDA